MVYLHDRLFPLESSRGGLWRLCLGQDPDCFPPECLEPSSGTHALEGPALNRMQTAWGVGRAVCRGFLSRCWCWPGL